MRGLRVVVVVALAGAAVVAAAAPSGAKGMVTARMLAGPGITDPLRLADRTLVNQLAQATRAFDVAWSHGEAGPIDPPIGDLGPRYSIEYRLMTGADETMPIRQELYPYAGGGPVVHTPGGQALEQVERGATKPCRACRVTPDVWHSVSPEVLGLLHRLDLPVPSTRLVARGARPADVDSAWTTVRDDAHGLRLRIPASWNAAATTMLPVQVDPVMPIAVGTAAVEPQREGECGVVPQRALAAVGPHDAFVGVYVTAGLASWGASVPARPRTFASALPWRLGPPKCSTGVTARMHSLAFEEGGTRLTLMVATGAEISPETRAELVAVLDSLRARVSG